MRTLTSTNSRYDRWRQGNATLTAQELNGLSIVKSKCTPCHSEPFFTDHDFHNTGLQAVYNDPFHENIRTGRYRITGNDADRGKFKTPSLRNIMVTAPYMHDGRIPTLDAVLDHYNGGVVMSPQLDPLLQKPGQPLGIQLNATERNAIKAFLNTLTDSTFLGLR
jgi:cytochrome c peroxidase